MDDQTAEDDRRLKLPVRNRLEATTVFDWSWQGEDSLEEDFSLGRGEAACIALARQHRWTVASDDAQAIKTCKAIGVPFVTALTKDKSAAARELMEYGWTFVLMEEYRKGRLSLGKLSQELGLSISETMDLLTEHGIQGHLDYEDY